MPDITKGYLDLGSVGLSPGALAIKNIWGIWGQYQGSSVWTLEAGVPAALSGRLTLETGLGSFGAVATKVAEWVDAFEGSPKAGAWAIGAQSFAAWPVDRIVRLYRGAVNTSPAHPFTSAYAIYVSVAPESGVTDADEVQRVLSDGYASTGAADAAFDGLVTALARLR